MALTDGDSRWGIAEQIQAATFDAIQGGNWQRGGGKGPRPKPMERPGLRPDTEKFGSGRTREELDELLRVHAGREVTI